MEVVMCAWDPHGAPLLPACVALSAPSILDRLPQRNFKPFSAGAKQQMLQTRIGKGLPTKGQACGCGQRAG